VIITSRWKVGFAIDLTALYFRFSSVISGFHFGDFTPTP